MRRGVLLPGLLALALLPACGPGGHLDLDAVEVQRAESAVDLPKTATRRVVRRATVSAGPAADGEAPPARAPYQASIALGRDAPWTVARDRLFGAAQPGRAPVVLEERSGGAARRVTWSPTGTYGSTRPDLHLRVLLLVREGQECLDATIQGSAWAARYGCDAPTIRRIRGWGEEARPELGRLLDEAIRAVASDPRRLAVRFDVSTTVASAVDWTDVYPLAEEALLCDAGLVRLVPDARGARRAPGANEASLLWLAAHQAPDGRWSAAGFGDACDGNPMQAAAAEGAGDVAYDVGATGLALLAYLGAGYTNRGRHPFAKTVSKGVRYLKTRQGWDGRFAASGGPWADEQHAIATLALVEIFGMTGSPIYRSTAQRGLDALADGGSHAELDVLRWTTAAYASARLLCNDAMRRDREPALSYDRVRADEVLACCRDRSVSDRAKAVAVGIFGRILLGGEDPRSERLRALATTIRQRPPATGEAADAQHALFGSLALYQVGGENWKAWNPSLKETVLASQRRGGSLCCYRGTWDPVGAGAGRFGRVGATALRTLTLEVYYRYDHVFACP